MWEAFSRSKLTEDWALEQAADWPQDGSMEENGIKNAGMHFTEYYGWVCQCVFASIHFQVVQATTEDCAYSFLHILFDWTSSPLAKLHRWNVWEPVENLQSRIPNRNLYGDVNWLHPKSQISVSHGEPFFAVGLKKGMYILPRTIVTKPFVYVQPQQSRHLAVWSPTVCSFR